MRHVTPGGARVRPPARALSERAARPHRQPPQIPITTSSDEARQLYLKGRDLAEKLRATDAHALYEQAVAKDPNFALAYVGLANTAGTTKEFIDAATQAASLAGSVSEGERHIILAMDAGLKNQPDACSSISRRSLRMLPERRARAEPARRTCTSSVRTTTRRSSTS